MVEKEVRVKRRAASPWFRSNPKTDEALLLETDVAAPLSVTVVRPCTDEDMTFVVEVALQIKPKQKHTFIIHFFVFVSDVVTFLPPPRD